jgi:hypothetical protein
LWVAFSIPPGPLSLVKCSVYTPSGSPLLQNTLVQKEMQNYKKIARKLKR